MHLCKSSTQTKIIEIILECIERLLYVRHLRYIFSILTFSYSDSSILSPFCFFWETFFFSMN